MLTFINRDPWKQHLVTVLDSFPTEGSAPLQPSGKMNFKTSTDSLFSRHVFRLIQFHLLELPTATVGLFHWAHLLLPRLFVLLLMQAIPMFKFTVSLPASVRQKTEFGQSESVWKQQFCRETVSHSLWAASTQLTSHSCCYYQDLFYSAFWNRLCSPLSSKAMSFTITFFKLSRVFPLSNACTTHCGSDTGWVRSDAAVAQDFSQRGSAFLPACVKPNTAPE